MYEKKVCGYPNPNQSPEKIDFFCRPGCERIFSKHFDESKIPFDANNKSFNFAGFLHDSLEVSVKFHFKNTVARSSVLSKL